MVQISLPLPVGADMIALAILVVAVRGSMVVDEEVEEEPVAAALGAMVVWFGASYFLLFVCIDVESVPMTTWLMANPFEHSNSHPIFL